MLRVELLNDHGDWILRSLHKNERSAARVCAACEQEGMKVRILKDGKVINVTEPLGLG